MSEWPLLWQAIVLGVIQGLTEFLPVSSSAHLVLVPLLGGTEYLGKSFDVALHGGTLAAAIWALPTECREVVVGCWHYLTKQTPKDTSTSFERLGPHILLAALVTAVCGFALEYRASNWFHGLLSLALALAVFGILLAAVDRYARHNRELDSLPLTSGLWLGLSQALAFIPGVSRSGIVLTAARGLGLSRLDSVKISFLCSIPVIGGAVLVKAWRGFDCQGQDMQLVIAAGMAASALSGMLTWKLLRWLCSRASFAWFAVYRVLLASYLLVIWYQQ